FCTSSEAKNLPQAKLQAQLWMTLGSAQAVWGRAAVTRPSQAELDNVPALVTWVGHSCRAAEWIIELTLRCKHLLSACRTRGPHVPSTLPLHRPRPALAPTDGGHCLLHQRLEPCQGSRRPQPKHRHEQRLHHLSGISRSRWQPGNNFWRAPAACR